MKKIAILGSTGSIGTQTLDVISKKEDLEVVGISAGSNIEMLEAQIRRFHPLLAAVGDEKKAQELKIKVADTNCRVVGGMDGLLELAQMGPCIIVGRCADYILREREDCLNVFIHASMAARADRIVRLYGSSEKSPEKRLEEKDKRRRVYYKHYTDGDWGMSQNYHLSLDSGIIGIQRCVDIISELAKTL